MTRVLFLAGALLFVLSASSFGQIIDPNVGFCDTPSSSCGADPNIITSSTSFGMWSFGNGQDANQPWFLLVAVPEKTAGAATAPAITSSSFTLGAPADAGTFGPSTAGSVEDFAIAAGDVPANFKSNNSFNNSNLFGSAEQTAYGGTPNFFEIFVYKDSTEGFSGQTAYSFTTNMVNGTIIGAVALGGKKDNIQFSTPFTTAGLVDSPNGGGGGGGGGSVPEPTSIVLLATAGVFAGNAFRKKARRS